MSPRGTKCAHPASPRAAITINDRSKIFTLTEQINAA